MGKPVRAYKVGEEVWLFSWAECQFHKAKVIESTVKGHLVQYDVTCRAFCYHGSVWERIYGMDETHEFKQAVKDRLFEKMEQFAEFKVKHGIS
jgi:hypothetical protein